MKETMRDHAPAPQGVVNRGPLSTGFSGQQEAAPLAPQSRAVYSSGVGDGIQSSAPHTQSSIADTHTKSSSTATNDTQSVIDKLQSNVQASVREATGKQDLDVGAPQPSTSIGKRILEGVGLGGDERQTTISKQVP